MLLRTLLDEFLHIIVHLFHVLRLIFGRAEMTLVSDIVRHIAKLVFKRLAANIIFLDTETPKCAKKIINTYLVQVFLIAHNRFKERFTITTRNRSTIEYSFSVFISSKNFWIFKNSLKGSVRFLMV